MSSRAAPPIVAIVGRPNVGKSTLFNRYAGHRRALVADSPGLTRDRIIEPMTILDRPILLVDTAGLDLDAASGLPAAVQAQAESALKDADAILFVVDGKAGLLPEDETIARILRRTRKPLLLAVNKIDQPTHHADRVNEFYRLGFEHVVGVSAEHGGGAFDALEQLVEDLGEPPDEGEPQEAEEIRVTLVGRPNVGKSSLVNRLLGEERVVVSEQAGTTRDAIDTQIDYDGEAFVLVDTAGLRRPGRREGTGERVGALMAVRSLERADVALLLIDGSEGFTDQDAHVARMIRDLGRAAVVVVNKWDLVGKPDRSDVLEGADHGLRFMADVPIVSISAKTGSGVRKLFPLIQQVAHAGAQRIATAELNRWLADVVARHDPGMARKGNRRHPVKFFYASQVAVRPPSFVLFCNDADSILESYRRFLENRLRETFGFEGTPVRLVLRNRRGRDAHGGAE
jgi:GTP-binding protein